MMNLKFKKNVVVNELISILDEKKKKKKQKLTEMELKLAGKCAVTALKVGHADKSYNNLKKLQLPVPKQGPVDLVVIPTQYNKCATNNPNTLSKRKERDRDIIHEMMQALHDGSLRQQFIIQHLIDNPEFTRKVVKQFYHKLYRLALVHLHLCHT